jgi:hypothetical protein
MHIATWIDQKRVIDSHLLPPDYNTINMISRLDEKALKRLVADGTICPTVKRSDVSKVLRIERVQADQSEFCVQPNRCPRAILVAALPVRALRALSARFARSALMRNAARLRPTLGADTRATVRPPFAALPCRCARDHASSALDAAPCPLGRAER